jgi:hypothetical protein
VAVKEEKLLMITPAFDDLEEAPKNPRRGDIKDQYNL